MTEGNTRHAAREWRIMGAGYASVSSIRTGCNCDRSGQRRVAARSGAGFDLIIRGGHIVDGTGNPWFAGDVGVRGDRVAAVGSLAGAKAVREIDARGLVVAPASSICTRTRISRCWTTAMRRAKCVKG